MATDDIKERWKFKKDPNKYDEEERKKVVQLLVECLIKVTFSHHFYKWKGEIKR